MAKNAFRKAYPKLLRDPYDFAAPKDALDQEEKLRVVKNCECSEPSTGFIDPIPDSLDPPQEGETPPCTVSQYSFCGTTGGDSMSELPVVYLANHADTVNPDVIFVPGIAPDGGGACYFLDDPSVDCADANQGVNLGPDAFVVVSHCNEPPCSGIQNTCEYLRLNICDNVPEASDPLFSPKTIVVHASFWGGVSFPRTVRWRNVCYRTPSNPCIPEPDPNDIQPPFADLEKEDNCEVEECLCCDDIRSRFKIMLASFIAHLRFMNSGNLPTDAGHDFSDPNYILYPANSGPLDPFLLNGDTETTLCHDRSETWRLILVEVDYYMLTSTFLYNNGTWLDTDTYPDAEIEGLTTPFDYFAAADYETQIQATTSHDWFRSAFNTCPDPFGHVIEHFTMGGEGGFGNISNIRFCDFNPHVVTDNPDDHRFCNLMNSTISRFQVALNKLVAVTVSATAVLGESRYLDAASASSCALVINCVGSGLQTLVPFNKSASVVFDASGCTSTTAPGAPVAITVIGVRFDSGKTGANFEASAACYRGTIQCDLSAFTSGDPLVYLQLGLYGGQAGFGQVRPTAAPENKYGRWNEGDLTVGQISNTGYVTGTEATLVPAGTCNADGSGWQVTNQIVVLYGSF